ncbi:hypothetical protein BB8028_0008g01140 [Beauveria bassiana]|uniref:Protein kinase domain-containing protein n=1 Tax=Beauveria bassiana TaxID=176275 RepID=A0A2S7YN62_BEABA|nr:hypothetical protein BB8028_0008g01140 [Beauveria bassiana]
METFASRHLRDEAADVTDLDEPTNPLSDNERRRVYRARTLQDVDGKEGDSSAETTAKVSSSIIARQQAKITSAFEKNTPDFTNALVVAGYERHRVAEAVRHASEVQLPAARLIFVCPVSLGTTSQFSTSVRLHDICGRSIVAALQRTEDVDFHFRVPYHSEADSSSRGDLKVLEGRIFYHPSSDDCVLHNLSDTIYYASKHDRTQRHRLGKGSNTVLQPGLWRISAIISGNTGKKSCPLADVLILPRRFCVVRTTRTTDHAKRAYVEQPENNVLHKRPKVHPAAQAMLERSIASSAIPVLERVTVAPVSGPVTLKNHDTRVKQIEAVGDVLLHLRDGEVVIIKSSPHLRGNVSVERLTGRSPADYQLSYLHGVGQTAATNVFACQHTRIPGRVVAKVTRVEHPLSLPNRARTWTRETTILRKLRHKNIMELKGSDGRLLTIFLEHLPPSLSHFIKSWESTQYSLAQHSLVMLRDITAALAYLKREGITHNDIKPLNIAYSPARGAVLLDFGMASMDADEDIGGTPPYMPPEYAGGRLRGHLGDVWAAGVTLLIVLRKLKQPVRADYFDLEDVHNEGSEHRSIMNNWLERVAQAKATLDLNEDGIESLVEKMLHEDRSKRISAEQVQKRLLLPDNK